MKHIIKQTHLFNYNKCFLSTLQKGAAAASEGCEQPLSLATLCGDSTSTILSTDSGVSSTSCENNHSGYSDESLSKSPANVHFGECARDVFAKETPTLAGRAG